MVMGIYRWTVLYTPRFRDDDKERDWSEEGGQLGVGWHIGISQADAVCMGMVVNFEQAQKILLKAANRSFSQTE